MPSKHVWTKPPFDMPDDIRKVVLELLAPYYLGRGKFDHEGFLAAYVEHCSARSDAALMIVGSIAGWYAANRMYEEIDDPADLERATREAKDHCWGAHANSGAGRSSTSH